MAVKAKTFTDNVSSVVGGGLKTWIYTGDLRHFIAGFVCSQLASLVDCRSESVDTTILYNFAT